MTTEKKQYWSSNGEDFMYESLRDMLDSIPDLEPGDIVHVGEAAYPETRQLIDAEDVIEQMTDRAWDIAGEYAMDYPDASKEAMAELDQFLEAWITKKDRAEAAETSAEHEYCGREYQQRKPAAWKSARAAIASVKGGAPTTCTKCNTPDLCREYGRACDPYPGETEVPAIVFYPAGSLGEEVAP